MKLEWGEERERERERKREREKGREKRERERERAKKGVKRNGNCMYSENKAGRER